jgi:hypothetical protein
VKLSLLVVAAGRWRWPPLSGFSFNPGSCVFNVTLQQIGYAVGGTGQLASATGSSTATVSARGRLRRASDGSCSLDQVPLSEVDKIESEGTLSF